jgi:hypothetical protein
MFGAVSAGEEGGMGRGVQGAAAKALSKITPSAAISSRNGVVGLL